MPRLAAAALAASLASSSFAAAPASAAALPAFTGITWSYTPSSLASTCDAVIAETKTRMAPILARVAATPADNMAKLVQIETVQADLSDGTIAQQLLQFVSTDKRLRDASTACNQKASNYGVEVSANPTVFAIAESAMKDASAAQDSIKLAEIYVENGRTSGAGLPASQRAAAIKMFDKLNDLERDFGLALSNDATTVSVSQAEAQGLPATLLATSKRAASGYVVAVNESTIEPFLQNERSGAARKRFYVAYYLRGGHANVTRLEQAVALREKLARRIGFKTWAAYKLSTQMAQDPARVINFLTTIDAKLLLKAHEEVAELAALKRASGDPTPFARWDTAYYENLLEKTKYAVDDNVVRQYFPVDHVIASIFKIYETLLSVQFQEIKPADAWAPGVREYAIVDDATRKPIGWLYFDLYPRPGKYDHFANFSLRGGRALPDGSYQKPVTSIIGNWPLPAPGKPALLSHDDVVTFFHEFGHAMHSTLSIAPYETLYGTNVRRDFVEAPSQMLENWMWQPSILQLVSANVRTGKPLPLDLIKRMVALKHVFDGLDWTGQAFYALYDMSLHTAHGPVDATALWSRLEPQDTALPMVPGTLPEASFGHLMGGYDAGYYGYLWSKVYAQDMFTVFQRYGLLSPVAGARYRKDILQPGASVEPDVLVRNFLGRPLNYDAFYNDIGITPTK